MINEMAAPSPLKFGKCPRLWPYHQVSASSAAICPASRASAARKKVLSTLLTGRLQSAAERIALGRDDNCIGYGIRIDDPVVPRASRSLCDLAASLSA